MTVEIVPDWGMVMAEVADEFTGLTKEMCRNLTVGQNEQGYYLAIPENLFPLVSHDRLKAVADHINRRFPDIRFINFEVKTS